MKTAVEWLQDTWLNYPDLCSYDKIQEWFKQAKEMERNDTDNKVIHFAEWLTKKHTSTLITLYEHFEEQYYNETFKSE